MKITIRNSDLTALQSDIQTIVPEWESGVLTRRLHPDHSVVQMIEVEGELTTEPYENISGNRIDIIDKGREVITPATYDEEGTLLTEAVYGDYIVEIQVPDDYNELTFGSFVSQAIVNGEEIAINEKLKKAERKHAKEVMLEELVDEFISTRTPDMVKVRDRIKGKI